MNAQDLLKAYLSYVPALVARGVAARDAQQEDDAHDENFPAAVLFADISGFTALTERLAGRGAEGVETLTTILNAYFGRMINTIHSHGGDIIKFAGDACMAVWPAASEGELGRAVQQCAQCAMAVQSSLRDFHAPDGTKLSLRVALGAGPVRFLQIGGMYGRWESVIAGNPLSQVGDCSHLGEPGEVVVSAEAWPYLAAGFSGDEVEHGVHRLLASEQVAELSPLPMPVVDESKRDLLKRFIPAAIHHRIDAGQGVWLAELRRVTVLFINLPDMHARTELADAQQAMRTLQEALYRYEGSVNKLSVDDKGVSLLAVFGLPPLSHNDDPLRGLLAAMEIRDVLKERGWQYAIGVTSGRAFCGSIGNERRREYTIMGDIVNLSARLMQAAKNDILCDESTASSAREVKSESCPPLRLKGKANAVAAYRPIERMEGQEGDEEIAKQGYLVGRHEQQQLLEKTLARTAGGNSSVAIIEGDAGIGKTALSSWLRDRAADYPVARLRGFASAVDKSTPYYIWSAILEQIFGLRGISDKQQRTDKVLGMLAYNPAYQKLSPLLNDILSINVPENDVTVQLLGEARADNINEIIIEVLKHVASEQPLLLIIDNAHWLDSASWSLLRLVARDVSPMFLLLITRPLAEPLPKTFRHLKSSPDTLQLSLGALDEGQTVELACSLFGAERIDGDITSLFREKSQGNPFFIEQIVSSLQETEAVQISDGVCQCASSVGDISSLNIPDTLEGLITERIDRLSVSQQLTLKAASVVGGRFNISMLLAIYPIKTDQEKLSQYLEDFQRLGFVHRTGDTDNGSYVFEQILVQEVAYNLMLFAQRQQLHGAIAGWYEKEHPENLAPYYSLLMYHYNKVGNDEKDFEYSIKAGEQAIRGFANIEALEIFDKVMKLDDKLGSPTSGKQRAYWYKDMGEAHYALAEFNESRRCISEALALMNVVSPRPGKDLIVSLLKEVWQQIMHRLYNSKYYGVDRDQAAVQLTVSSACERIAQIEYMNNDKPRVLYYALRALNVSERVGTSAELARSYANICVVAGMIPSKPLAELYYRLARETAARTNNLQSQAYVYMVTAMYRTTTAQWQDIRDSVEPGIEIAERIGDRRRWDELMFTLAPATYRLGKHSISVGQYEELYQSGLRRGILQIQVWGLSGMLYSRIPSGDVDDIVAKIEALPFNKLGSGDQILANGVLAHAWWCRGDEQKALGYADHAAALMASSDAVAQYVLEGFVGTAEVYLGVCENDPLRLSSVRGRLKTILKGLANYAHIYTIGKPQLYRCEGRLLWIEGKHGKAMQKWQKGLAIAREFAMRYELALLHYEIGRHTDKTNRHDHLKEARDAFDFAGATLDYNNTISELEQEY